MKLKLFVFFIILMGSSCDPYYEDDGIMKTYLHISHTRNIETVYLDNTVLSADYNQYDMLWLGGDLTYLTSETDASMIHVDSIFDVGSPNTLWSLGNHDHTNLPNISKYTGRPPYYTTHRDGITIIVADTEENLSIIDGEQKEFIHSILDTVTQSSHVVLLHHKLIWLVDHIYLHSQISNVSNAELGECNYCLNPNNFYEDIYPKLKEVKERGIEVVCVGGDIGANVKKFEFVNEDGIHYLASGIYSGHANNKVLEFYHDVTNRELEWNFIGIDSLSK